jgi:hypothetical protein
VVPAIGVASGGRVTVEREGGTTVRRKAGIVKRVFSRGLHFRRVYQAADGDNIPGWVGFALTGAGVQDVDHWIGDVACYRSAAPHHSLFDQEFLRIKMLRTVCNTRLAFCYPACPSTRSAPFSMSRMYTLTI